MEDVEIGMTQGREMKKGGLGPTWDLGVGGGGLGALSMQYMSLVCSQLSGFQSPPSALVYFPVYTRANRRDKRRGKLSARVPFFFVRGGILNFKLG